MVQTGYDKRRSRHSRARGKRLRYRLALFGAALLAVLLTLAMSYPIRLSALPRQLDQKLRSELGLAVAYEDAWFWVLWPRVEIKGLLLADVSGERSQLVARANRVDISLNPLAMISGWGRVVRHLRVEAPSPLEIALLDGVVCPPDFVTRVVDRLSSRAVAEQSRGWPFGLLELSDASVIVRQKPSATVALPLRPSTRSVETTLALVQRVDLRIKETAGQRLTVTCHGQITMREAPSWVEVRGTILGTNEFAGELKSPQFTGSWRAGARGTATWNARELRADLRALRREGVWECFGDAIASSIDIVMPQHAVAYRDENVRASLRARLDGTRGVASIEKAALESPYIALELTGVAGWKPDWDYQLNINAERIGAPYLELLNSPLPPGFQLVAGEGEVAASLHAAGQREQLTSLVGKLTFSTVTLQTPHFRRPLKELQGELDFEPSRMVIHQLAAKLGNARLNLDGTFTGDYLSSRTGQLVVRWKSVSSARELLDILLAAAPQATPLRQISDVRGSVETEGELVQNIQGLPDQWEPPRVSGKVAVQGLALNHPALPAALTEGHGECAISNSIVNIDRFEGTFAGQRLTLQGALEGKKVFWQDPVLTGTLVADLNITPDAKGLTPAWREQIRALKFSGRFHSEASFSVPLSQPAAATYAGEVHAQEVGCEISTPYFKSVVSNTSAKVRWDGKALSLVTYQTKLNGFDLAGDGYVTPGMIRLRLKGSGTLDQIQSALPRLEPYVAMGGPVRGEVTLETKEEMLATDGAKDQLPLVRLVTTLPKRLGRAYEKGNFKGQGTIVAGNETQGARFRHHGMPPARTLPYGLTVPDAQIADIRGTFRIQDNVIQVSSDSPLRCSMADTPNCRLWGTITLRPSEYPQITFSVETEEEARMDTWLTGWGQALRPVQQTGRPPLGNRFDLEANLRLARMTYKGEKVEESSGRIIYSYVRNAPPRRVEFRELEIRGFGGVMRGRGVIEAWWQDPDNYPRWQTEVSLDGVRIPPLSRWVFRDPRPVEGRISGRIRLEGVKTDLRRLRGSGTASLSEVEVGHLPFILKLFQVINLTQTRGLFEKAAYTSREQARFSIADGVLKTSKLDLETEGLLLEVSGLYQLERQEVDLLVRLNLVESSIVGGLPIVGQFAKYLDRGMGKAIVSFRVQGPASQPFVTPVPLPLVQKFLEDLTR